MKSLEDILNSPIIVELEHFASELEKFMDLSEDNLQEYIDFIHKSKYIQSRDNFKNLLIFLANVDHYRPKSNQCVLRILDSIQIYMTQFHFSSFDLTTIFDSCYHLLYYLFYKGFIEYSMILLKAKSNQTLFGYFSEVIRKKSPKDYEEMTKKHPWILRIIEKSDLTDYHNRCLKGFNSDYCLEVIRNDDYDQFIDLLRKNCFDFTSNIPKNIYMINEHFVPDDNITYIDYAAFYGSLKIFKFMILEVPYIPKLTQILALNGGHSEIIHILEEKLGKNSYADLKYLSFSNIFNFHRYNVISYLRDVHNFTFPPCALAISVCYYNFKFTKEIFEDNKDNIEELLSEPDEFGWHSIHWASRNGNTLMIKFLLSFKDKIDVNRKTDNGTSALLLACQHMNLEIVKLLCNCKDIDLNCKDPTGFTPFNHVCDNGDLSIVKYFLEEIFPFNNNFDPNIYNEDHEYPLHRAAQNDQNDVVMYLLKHKDIIDVNSKDIYDWTFFHWIGENTNLTLLKELIHQNLLENFDVNCQNNQGNTALHLIFHSTDADFLKEMFFTFLEIPQVDINIKNKSGVYLFHFIYRHL
ncbi:hypothetical protein TRFO_29679 [Tritrichomonas foetus]|uniref:Uncharacterized protein n=1 Tax=Tritrichomonas foetus TaxID=1144522 RepID=A0A1J4JV35_9EUKA|nr:hypothetical protein TRFO_29679 [Tritrichomonas foetus]|eukprot:OHT03023.1 hypothetical protein TRFO_29679 [Tritrichomonas foetus]